jgi:putative peptidoglycan lipid II flippase
LGIDPKLGAAGLTASAGIAGWVEFILLRRRLNERIGSTGLPISLTARLWSGAVIAAAAAWAVKLAIGAHDARITAVLTLIPYGVVYLVCSWLMRVGSVRQFLRKRPG